MHDYELVDLRDNDHHDTGPRDLMVEYAADLNKREGVTYWAAKPAGWSDKHFIADPEANPMWSDR